MKWEWTDIFVNRRVPLHIGDVITVKGNHQKSKWKVTERLKNILKSDPNDKTLRFGLQRVFK